MSWTKIHFYLHHISCLSETHVFDGILRKEFESHSKNLSCHWFDETNLIYIKVLCVKTPFIIQVRNGTYEINIQEGGT